MKTIDQLNAEHAKQVATLTRELETAKSLPIPPHSVMNAKGAPRASYKVETLREALALFSTYAARGAIMPMEIRKNGCTVISPVELMDPRYQEAPESIDYGVLLEIQKGEWFHRFELEFYAKGADYGPVKINVRIEPAGYGANVLPRALAPVMHQERGRNNGNRVIKQWFTPSPAINGYADKTLSFSSGDTGSIKKSCDYRHLFVFDIEHIENQISTICDEIEGE